MSPFVFDNDGLLTSLGAQTFGFAPIFEIKPEN